MTVANNTKQLKELRKENGKLRVRINSLVDDFATLKDDLNRFKKTVATDVKYLTERVDG